MIWLTEQGGQPIPPDISGAIAASGGAVHDLGGRIGERVRALRDLADGREFCVLHQDPSDVVPSLALLAEPRAWATILVDHADHAFWLGTSVADVVAHLRASAVTAASTYRGLAEDAATIIPLPFAPTASKVDRAKARVQLGIEPHEVLLLSVASEYKFGDGTAGHFLDALEPLVAGYAQLRVLVGPRDTGRWRTAAARFGGRVQAVGPQLDIATHLAAADIYVDSYPFPSFTSALQAAQYGLPTVGRRAGHPDLVYLQLDDEAGGAAITWVSDDAALATVIASWCDDAPARRRAGSAAAEEIHRVSRDDKWLRSIERTYARALALTRSATKADAMPPVRLPEQLAEALADVHHWGRVDGAFFHTLVRDRDGVRDHCARDADAADGLAHARRSRVPAGAGRVIARPHRGATGPFVSHRGDLAADSDRAENTGAVSVVILNWNGADDTIACLDSLREVPAPHLDVIVVDNGSRDDSVSRIRASHPDVSLLEAHTNLGFSAGNNLGIRAALARGAVRVLILNNDTVVDPHAIELLCDELDHEPAAGAVCPLLTFSDPPDVVWFAGATFDPTRGRSGRMTGYRRPLGAWVDDMPRQIDRGVGAAMLVRSEVIDQVGLLRDEYFFLYEDIDWSLRMRAAGWTIRFVPEARIVHKVAASQAGQEVNPDSLYYLLRNHLTVCERHAPIRGLRNLRRQAVIAGVLICSGAHVSPLRSNAAALLAGWRDFRRHQMGRRP